jgi:hypothetical protein
MHLYIIIIIALPQSCTVTKISSTLQRTISAVSLRIQRVDTRHFNTKRISNIIHHASLVVVDDKTGLVVESIKAITTSTTN